MIVCRTPKEKELEILNNYYTAQLNNLQAPEVKKALAVGEFPLDEKVDQKALAALARVISTIYNLEETITKS